MKWYQHLFWKIFLTIWLISAVGTGLTVWLVQSVAEQRQNLALQETRARAQAELMLERYERGDTRLRGLTREQDEHSEKRHRLLPLWIVDSESGQLMFDMARPAPDAKHSFRLEVQSPSGRRFQVIAPLPPEGFYLAKILAFMVSAQAVFVLFVSALASLLLSWLIVRPVNQLRSHTRDLYAQQNLSSRAADGLSRRNDEIGQLAREFNQMASFVEDTLTAQQRLLQDVSHELRAPLARLQVAAGLAEQRLGEGDATANRINKECARLDGLIGEILSLSRLDQTDPEGTPFLLRELLGDLVDDARFSHPQRVIQWQLEPATLRLKANPLLLRRALGNCLSNALKYTPGDTAIELNAYSAEGGIEICLRDHGPGVSDTLLQRMTEPFVRGSGGHGDGYGLGLSIARRALERMGGRLSQRNHPQGGLEQRLWLPLRMIVTAAPAASTTPI